MPMVKLPLRSWCNAHAKAVSTFQSCIRHRLRQRTRRTWRSSAGSDCCDVGKTFSEGAAILGLACGEPNSLRSSFTSGSYLTGVATGLAEGDFKPLLLVPNSGKQAAADFDASLAGRVGCWEK